MTSNRRPEAAASPVAGRRVALLAGIVIGACADFAASGYVGLQNHDHDSSVWFRNIRIKDLTAAP